MTHSWLKSLSVMLIGCGSAAALAQTPAAPSGGSAQPPASANRPAVVGASPERTTASYGDWLFRCERSGEGSAALRVCELVQGVQVQGQQAPVAQIAIGRIRKSDPLKLTLVLPSNVLLTSAPKFSVEDKEGQLIDTAWQRCLPIGCLSEAVLKDDTVKAMRARNDQGRIEFKDGSGRDIRLPFSLRGVAPALDALARE